MIGCTIKEPKGLTARGDETAKRCIMEICKEKIKLIITSRVYAGSLEDIHSARLN